MSDNVVLNYNGNVADYTLEYDENGNMIRGFDFSRPAQPMERGYNTTPMEWNAENKPTKIPHSVNGTTSIVYDGDGKRAKKVNGSNVTYYVNDYFEETNGTSTMYIFAGSTRVAMIKNDQTYYYHKDHLGSTALITDDSQSIVGSSKTEYMPFGLERTTGGQTVTNYKFTDQEQDTSTGLYNYDARLYDPGLGMFISADSIVQDWHDPQSLNRYAYCRNNPLKYVDPDGHAFVMAQKLMADQIMMNNAAAASAGAYRQGQINHNEVIASKIMEFGRTLNTPFAIAAKYYIDRLFADKNGRGGRHRDTKGPVGDGKESHHIPSKGVMEKYGIHPDDGSAIQMDPEDHMDTGSWGNSGESQQFRDEENQLIEQGLWDDAIQKGIDDVQEKNGTKYDKELGEMIDNLPDDYNDWIQPR